jgi:CHAT domain-containing protein
MNILPKKRLIYSVAFFLFGVTLSAQTAADTLFFEKKVDSLNALAVKFLRARQYDTALPIAINAQQMAAEKLGKQNPRYATASNWLGGIYYNTQVLDKAEINYLEAIKWRGIILGTAHPDYGRSNYNLAMMYMNSGRLNEAEPLFLLVKNIMERAVGNRHPDYAIAINGLATLYLKMGKYPQAEPLNLAIVDIRAVNPGKNHPDYAQSLYNLGLLYMAQGKYTAAEDLFTEAKDIQAAATGKMHPDYAKYLNGLAGLYLLQDNHTKAELLYKEILSIQEQTLGLKHPEYIFNLGNLALLYSQAGLCQQADSIFEVTFERAAAANLLQHPDYPTLLENQAALREVEEQMVEAEKLYRQALELKKTMVGEEHPTTITFQQNLALHYLNRGLFEKSAPLLEKVYQLRKNTLGERHPDHSASTQNLFLQHQFNRQFAEAEKWAKITFGLLRDQLTEYASSSSERQMLSYLDNAERNSASIYSFTHRSPSPQMAELSYDNALFFNGFLLDYNREIARFIAQADTNTQALYANWQVARHRLADEYLKTAKERTNVLELEQKADALERLLIQKIPSLQQNKRIPVWQDIQKALKTGEAAIEFINYRYFRVYDTDTILYAALVVLPGHQHPYFIPLCHQKALEQRLNNNKDVAYWLGGENALYHLLWKPLEPLLKDVQTVYYAPSGFIHHINLDAISPHENGQKSLIDQYKLVRLNSTRQLVLPPTPLTAQNPGALLFGGIQYEADKAAIIQKNTENGVSYRGNWSQLWYNEEDSTQNREPLPYLPATLSEINKIQQLLAPDYRVKALSGFSATEEAFKTFAGRSAASPRIIHVATHGFSQNKIIKRQTTRFNPVSNSLIPQIDVHPYLRSGLYLAGANFARKTQKPLEANMEDGVLTAYEVSALSLPNTELVVLSACNTGLGTEMGHEGVFGLQRAFKVAGARYLLISLWAVPDAATEELMTLFYTRWLTQKMDIPTAFHYAQLDMKKKYKDPEMWAGFVLVE